MYFAISETYVHVHTIYSCVQFLSQVKRINEKKNEMNCFKLFSIELYVWQFRRLFFSSSSFWLIAHFDVRTMTKLIFVRCANPILFQFFSYEINSSKALCTFANKLRNHITYFGYVEYETSFRMACHRGFNSSIPVNLENENWQESNDKHAHFRMNCAEFVFQSAQNLWNNDRTASLLWFAMNALCLQKSPISFWKYHQSNHLAEICILFDSKIL